MTKISWNQKIIAIEAYLTGTQAKEAVAKKYGISPLLFRIMLGIYDSLGRKGLLNPPKISAAFRVNLVQWKQENQASIPATCVHFALMSPATVYRWEKLYQQKGQGALIQMHQGRSQHDQRKCPGQASAPGIRELILAHTKRCLKKNNCLETASHQEISQIIISLRPSYKLADLIAALPISMSTFQYWQHRLHRPNPADLALIARIKQVFEKNHGNYGVRRLTPIIRRQYAREGQTMPNHKKIQRIMSEQGWICQKYTKHLRKYDSSRGPQNKKAKNRFRRRFTSDRLFQKMVCDVTELRAKNGDKVYLEVIKDLYSKRLIEWEMSAHPDLAFSLAPSNA